MLRFTPEQAAARGFITKEEAKAMGATSCGQNTSPGKGKKRGNPRKPPRLACSIEGDLPQEVLWRALCRRFPADLRRGNLRYELRGVVPGRAFAVDIAFLDERLAIEMDGWEYHGRFLKDFKRDRDKDKALMRAGWRGPLRFYTEEIIHHLDAQIETVAAVLEAIRAERGLHPVEPVDNG